MFCIEKQCNISNRFCCSKCIALGSHKKHDCIEITELQQVIRDFQKAKTCSVSTDQEMQMYNNCMERVGQTLKSVRIKIDKLLSNLEVKMMDYMYQINPQAQGDFIRKIDPEIIFQIFDFEVQNQICLHLLGS